MAARQGADFVHHMAHLSLSCCEMRHAGLKGLSCAVDVQSCLLSNGCALISAGLSHAELA